MISLYAIDPDTGALQLRNRFPTGKGANWVEIVSFEVETAASPE